MKKLLVGAAVGATGLMALTGWAAYAAEYGDDTSETVKDRVGGDPGDLKR